ncbi:4-alpha-glucanotransferase [uncultured Roseobacter sp.]|uniref:4-alpha-glucanotransferase n=1 Tax=uncultured Roseobacter sp. TaxID=114847 RepID=UPI0026298CBB|nr:4-alpha-glucanotransferase [uncultured Roseobacter sp.]
MSADQILSDLADHCGLVADFKDLDGIVRSASPDTQRALLQAMGVPVGSSAEMRETLQMMRAEDTARILPRDVVVPSHKQTTVPCASGVAWQMILEGTSDVYAEGKSRSNIEVPALPSGVHDLQVQRGSDMQSATLIAAPDRVLSLQDMAGADQTWGVVAALYGLRSERNQGLGDFEDLAQLGEILGKNGAGFLGINPVHALGWADVATISPYSPTHRGFLNTNHIALDRIPHVAAPTSLPAQSGPRIDYAGFAQTHRAALRAAFETFQSGAEGAVHGDLAAFKREGGPALADYALFEALSETHGPDWRSWPKNLQTPTSAQTVAGTVDTEFHVWLQWLAARQLEAAHTRAQSNGMALGLYLDLAVGSRLGGAEAWGAAEVLAQSVSLGAPPDHLSPAGQTWQLAAFAPAKLQAQQYRPLRQVLRQAMQHCGVLRIDHALGLNRSYWVPENGAPGGYIRQPFQSLMGIIAIEAERARTLIVGEDLGLVPAGFRATMAARGIYGYTVAQYEKTDDGKFRKADDMRPQSLACFGTHDTPTLRGFWEGRDIGWWHQLGWIDAGEKAKAEERRALEKADLVGATPETVNTFEATDLATQAHRALAQGPTALVAVQLDDVLDVAEAQNLPGTVDEHPNWRRRSPVPVADMAAHAGLCETAKMMADAGRGTPKQKT